MHIVLAKVFHYSPGGRGWLASEPQGPPFSSSPELRYKSLSSCPVDCSLLKWSYQTHAWRASTSLPELFHKLQKVDQWGLRIPRYLCWKGCSLVHCFRTEDHTPCGSASKIISKWLPLYHSFLLECARFSLWVQHNKAWYVDSNTRFRRQWDFLLHSSSTSLRRVTLRQTCCHAILI